MPESPIPRSHQDNLLRVESARYALLRRMAFAMRHQMVVHLQPIGMVGEVMERRLKAPEPDLAQIQASMAKINGFSRAAVQSCLDVITWLAPQAGATVALDAGVNECLGLLRSHFSFRGLALQDEVGTMPMLVGRGALRNVLPACLLALTDAAAAPAEVSVSAEALEDDAVLVIRLRPAEGPTGFAGDAPYRLLQWHEVQAMARADGVEVSLEAEGARLAFPSTPAAAAPAG